MRNNKGFTIVELVIVIAVVAILASVLIPTFSGIVKKANISSDMQTARNMATILAAEKPIGPREAVDALKANGIERLEPKTKYYSFYWIKSINAVVLTSEGVRPIYPEELATRPFDPEDWFDLTAEYAKTEPETEAPPETEEETTAPPPEYVTVTYTCNNPEYIAQSLESVTIKYGDPCRIQINVADGGQYTITKYIVYQDGRSVMRSDGNELGTGVGFGASWGELEHNIEVYIHVVEYCIINFDGEGIKANKYKYRGLHVEAGTDIVFDADFLRENFIPDGYEIESVAVQAGGTTIADIYDFTKQELRLQNITENVNVTFVFKEK
jgi:prepilin-type N-terminal cleavage/methylation domain-containing protein